ncbi:Nitroimidazol reductase NimA, pyridoxamine 5'-phosphate oxidase superfamily [Halogranum amylolyticum]|uniref:Nitroimidazol reductase NimA, pyridoxamine 5'-phosphate oxidase superfamily n=1 Tax=Halogranum amylolyticum TaxID=660520 RepID=A0A1H8N515_9EURY|nr:pyridoxamine 5'-phosphate oxidase [Halogranum amylolyticum]SEO24553.1 Nitroimidazol reductase NimA, pyridoxamine 5'-phosphate oxidase superfamily [Halogranum amylolyticum]
MVQQSTVEFAGVWSPEEVDRFLTETTVPIRLACRTPRDDLWMLSLWYEYEDGEFRCATGADADIVEFLQSTADVAFEVSTNEAPYRGVRGRGTASLGPDHDKTQLKTLLDRYLGGTDSTLAESLLAPDREEVKIRITPEKLYSWDFSQRMSEFDDA